MRVEDAKGQPPSIPFWLGEAPARTDELSASVSRLRADIEALLPEVTAEIARARHRHRSIERYHLPRPAAQQLVEYLGAAKAVLGKLPKRDTLVFERFFDESGGQQLIIHAPFGARVNRAFGLSLRKKFCRTFNFELQAAATEDAIVLSLGETHSFELASVARFLNSKTVEDTLIQAMLDSPMFTARWRWNASISLAIRRSSGGKRTPPQIQRMASEDLIAVLFPDQIACAENLIGPARDSGSPARQADAARTACTRPWTSMGCKRSVARPRDAATSRWWPGICSSLRRSPRKSSPRGRTPILDDAPLEERRTQRGVAAPLARPRNRRGHGQARSRGHRRRCASRRGRTSRTPDELHDAMHRHGRASPRAGGRERRLDARTSTSSSARGAPRACTRRRTRLLGVRRMPAADPGRLSRQAGVDPHDRAARRKGREESGQREAGDHRSRARPAAEPGARHGARHGRDARPRASPKSTSR